MSTSSILRSDDSRQAAFPESCDWAFVRTIAQTHKRALFSTQGIALLTAAATVPVPLLFPILVDEILLDQPGPAVDFAHWILPASLSGPAFVIGLFLFATLLLRITVLGLDILQTRQFAVISGDISFQIRRALLDKLKRVSLAEYETLGSGGVGASLITDVVTVEEFITSTIGRFVVNVMTLAAIACVLLWMDWKLALFILVLNPLVVYATTLLGQWVRNLKLQENSAIESFQSLLTETLDGIHQLRASHREGLFVDRLVDRSAEIRSRSVDFHWKSKVANKLSFVLMLFGFDVFRAASMLAVLFSGLSVGQMMAVFSYLWFAMGPIQQLLGMQYQFYAADGALSRLDRLLQLREESTRPALDNPFVGRPTVSIRVRDLRFSYGPGAGHRAGTRPLRGEVLSGIDLDIEAGEKVALVGASGGGKSTFVRLLLGLYPATSGSIEFQGVSAESIGWPAVRENVVTVLQQSVLFNDTLRLNLTLGAEVPDEELWRVLQVVQLADEIAGLDDGLDTVVGRQGTRLSGGQRQRLAIGRMLLAKPSVVILDEATSALDLEVEERLQDALAQELAGRTMLIIAHRLSALRMADRVLVFEEGRVTEQGTHRELLERGGLYATIYEKSS